MSKKLSMLYVFAVQLTALASIAQLPSIIDVTGPPGTENAPVLRIYGDDTGDYFGQTFDFGDINGDGTDDLIVGAFKAGGSTGNLRAGEVYVVYGSADLPDASLNLNTNVAISPAGETRILGDKGDSVADSLGETDFGGAVTAGDVNGDGFDDIIASARLADALGREWAGTIFIFYGNSALPGTLLNLHTDGATSQFGETRIFGKGTYDYIGVLTLTSGDFNGDGYDDVSFGSRGVRNKAYIVYGGVSLPESILDLNHPAGTYNETSITGDGFSVDPETWPHSSCTGDVNGDGFDDLILGADNADPDGRTNSGTVYILYGSAALPGSAVDLRDLPSTNGATHIRGGNAGDCAGWAVASGDVDGDGFDDVIIGAPLASPAGRTSAGESYVVYGSPSLPGSLLDLSDADGEGATRILGDDGAVPGFAGDQSGRQVACADINGDGLDDVIVGATRAVHPMMTGGNANGETYVIFGTVGLRGITVDLNLPSVHPEDVRVLCYNGDVPTYGPGEDNADLNADGFADFAFYHVLNPSTPVPDAAENAGGVIAVFGRGTATSATAAERIKAGFAPRRGMGGRLSPVIRTWLSFPEGDDGVGGASLATVTMTRSNAAIANLGPLQHVADVFWEVNTGRTACPAAAMTFQYLDSEIEGLTEGDMQLFEAPSLSGPWTPVADQTLDVKRNEASGTGTGRFYAIADLTNTCPTANAGVDVTIQWTAQSATVVLGQGFDPDPNSALTFRWLNVTDGEQEVLCDWMATGGAGEADLALGALPPFPVGESRLRLEISDGICTVSDEMTLIVTNKAPTADAGVNVMILTSQQATTVLPGTVTDIDGDPLLYRWLLVGEGSSGVLLPFTAAGAQGEANLDLAQVQQLPIGQHTLRLEVTDGLESSTDDMVLTMDNAPPNLTLVGGGTYYPGQPVPVGGSASDFDGDLLEWRIQEGEDILASGQLQTIAGGAPVSIAPVDLAAAFGVGSHTLTLKATDGINDVSSDSCIVTVVDTEVPTLAPVPSVSQLWPPNHELVPVTVSVNAQDNSGQPIALRVSVMCDEPADALGAGTTEPDWVIDGVEPGPGGRIDLRLRSERSGKGDGRAYTITIVAEDTSGNTSSAQVQVVSPHDRGKK